MVACTGFYKLVFTVVLTAFYKVVYGFLYVFPQDFLTSIAKLTII